MRTCKGTCPTLGGANATGLLAEAIDLARVEAIGHCSCIGHTVCNEGLSDRVMMRRHTSGLRYIAGIGFSLGQHKQNEIFASLSKATVVDAAQRSNGLGRIGTLAALRMHYSDSQFAAEFPDQTQPVSLKNMAIAVETYQANSIVVFLQSLSGNTPSNYSKP